MTCPIFRIARIINTFTMRPNILRIFHLIAWHQVIWFDFCWLSSFNVSPLCALTRMAERFHRCGDPWNFGKMPQYILAQDPKSSKVARKHHLKAQNDVVSRCDHWMLRVLGLILLGRVVVFAESKQEYLESSARLSIRYCYPVDVLNNWLYFKVSLLQTGHWFGIMFLFFRMKSYLRKRRHKMSFPRPVYLIFPPFLFFFYS